jgi:hypothetical protein
MADQAQQKNLFAAAELFCLSAVSRGLRQTAERQRQKGRTAGKSLI